ncbi:glycoside hydrolase family protein [Burkholderia cenocepacia]|uniref:glycoside hydrolase family protein n=1 Tax=Burkholderia cenocepacia TaxID=95486 RepID=UPI001588F516|nr:hypothetical protein [Burkholderia cenocepacia]
MSTTNRYGGAGLVGIIGATAAAAVISLTGASEGVSLTPYNDKLAGTLATVCYGETNVPMRRYTLAECKGMLSNSLAGYAAGVRKTVPGFDSLTDGQKVAAIDYAYNRGLGSWARASRPDDPPSIMQAYRRRDFPAACELYPKWALLRRGDMWIDCSVRANGCYGIYTRRMKERAACLGE